MPSHLAATEAAAYAATPAPPKPGRLRRATPEPATTSGPTMSAADPPLPSLDELVAGINTVGFAPGAADDGQAARAGRQVVEYAAALRAGRSWWRRIWWSLHPGPLRWHRD
jgi:hypothetical protein